MGSKADKHTNTAIIFNWTINGAYGCRLKEFAVFYLSVKKSRMKVEVRSETNKAIWWITKFDVLVNEFRFIIFKSKCRDTDRHSSLPDHAEIQFQMLFLLHRTILCHCREPCNFCALWYCTNNRRIINRSFHKMYTSKRRSAIVVGNRLASANSSIHKL